MKSRRPAAIGIRVRRGMAVAIAISADRESPIFAARAELLLSDPKVPSSLRPLHALARQPMEIARPIIERDTKLVLEAAAESVRRFVSQLGDRGWRASGAAIVSDGEPPKIDNPHLEAHRDERRLFREAIASATRNHGIESIFLVEDEAAEESAKLTRWLAQIGESAGRPWRADEKIAALAARIAMARGS